METSVITARLNTGLKVVRRCSGYIKAIKDRAPRGSVIVGCVCYINTNNIQHFGGGGDDDDESTMSSPL